MGDRWQVTGCGLRVGGCGGVAVADRVGKVKVPLRGEKWVSTGVAARLMGVTRQTMWNWASANGVDSRRTPGGRFQVLVVDGGVIQAEKSSARAK